MGIAEGYLEYVAKRWRSVFSIKGLKYPDNLDTTDQVIVCMAVSRKGETMTEDKLIEESERALSLIDRSLEPKASHAKFILDNGIACAAVNEFTKAKLYLYMARDLSTVYDWTETMEEAKNQLAILDIISGDVDSAIEEWGYHLPVHSKSFNPYLRDFEKIQRSVTDYKKKKLAREALCRKYAWAVPDDIALSIIANYAPIIEMGAGAGYWGFLLKHYKVDIELYDSCPDVLNNLWGGSYRWAGVQEGEQEKLENTDRTLMLCWPPGNTNMASTMLQNYKGEWLIYIGEIVGRVPRLPLTGDPKFHSLIPTDWVVYENYQIPCWELDDIKDELYVFRRKSKTPKGERTWEQYINKL